jgi:hypothetical protein
MHKTGIGAPAVQTHLQRVDDELGAHVLGHRPANDHPGERVLDSGEVEPALPGSEIRQIGDPQHVRDGR